MSNMKNTTSISAFIKQAVYENNEGTRFVRRCQYNSAERSFTSVLMILQQLADIVENKYDDNNGTAANANENSDTDVDVDVDALFVVLVVVLTRHIFEPFVYLLTCLSSLSLSLSLLSSIQ
mmetsp:Transcript_15379/g.17294  ORF Transcript_15379/g.17294 Transcript_15379/m.17294 type:complete len:121 (+) Transcript_15379:60-422(+)